MDAKALLKERTELFDNVFQFKHNKRIPVASNISYWHYLDCGYNFNEVLYDYELMDKVLDEFIERYQFDSYMNLPGLQFMRISRVFGQKNFVVNREGNSIIYTDDHAMESSEYNEFREDPNSFYWTRIMPRRCVPGFTVGRLKDTMREFMDYSVKFVTIYAKAKEQYGALTHWKGAVMPPFETIFSNLRGMKGTALDLRKYKDEIQATLDAMFERESKPAMQNVLSFAHDYEGYVAPMQIAMLAHSMLNQKQFEDLYWRYVKPVVDFAIENNIRIVFYCEAEILRFAEYFQDIPRGLALLQHEQDDIFELRKRLPNIALMGGMPLTMLGNSSKQECIDYAKKLIDGLGDGFVLCQDKMGLIKTDIKRENLLAVNEVARNYT
jgi:hypothetical protein